MATYLFLKMKITITTTLVIGYALCGSVQAQDKMLDDNGRVVPLGTKLKSPPPHPIIVSISPDKHWLFCFRHFGSHASENYLYRSEDRSQFVPAVKDFDTQAWKFFCKAEGVSGKDTDIVNPAEFVSWSPDGSRLLFSLTSRLGLTIKELDAPLPPSNKTASGSVSHRADPGKPGVENWRAYFNLKTQRFELTDELRATNKDSRKRWGEGKQLEVSTPTPTP